MKIITCSSLWDITVRPPGSGVKVQLFEFPYRAMTWKKRGRAICMVEWRNDELFPRVCFMVANAVHPAWKVVRVYNGRANVDNRIKKAKNTLRWDKTSCRKFAALGFPKRDLVLPLKP